MDHGLQTDTYSMIELLVLQFFFPPVMGYLATTKGYKFWTWFIIGFFLPVISVFILFAMKTKPVQVDESKLVLNFNKDKVLYSRKNHR